MLGSRILVSAVLIPGFIALCVADHLMGSDAWILLLLCQLIAARCSYEMADLLRVRNLDPSFGFAALGSMAVIFSLWAVRIGGEISPGWGSLAALGAPMLVLTGVVLLGFVREAQQFHEPGKAMERLSVNLLMVGYIGVLLTMTAQLRWVAGARAGYFALASLVICVKCGDIGAYFCGRFLGKKKMAPRLSPGKTWMGFVGALLGATAGAVAWLRYGVRLFDAEWQPPALPWAVIYGVILGVVGLVGDLCESLIKRDVRRKDSAAFLPGFGGLLDLLDSILFAGPVAYLLWMVLPLATWE